jgi:hypothetical protein
VFLPLEDGEVILTEEIVALVRSGGHTAITLRGGKERESVFTPATLGKRASRFVRGHEWRISRKQTKETEANRNDGRD